MVRKAIEVLTKGKGVVFGEVLVAIVVQELVYLERQSSVYFEDLIQEYVLDEHPKHLSIDVRLVRYPTIHLQQDP